jgi:multidrug efflux system membrane fusion protein
MRTRFLIFPVALLVLVCAACAGEDGGAAAAAGGNGRGGRGGAAGGGIPVAVGTVVQKAMPIEISVIGAAEAFSSVAIRAQTTGQLNSVSFTEGDDVTAGQVLFTLDRRPMEAALQQAQANLDRDVAQAANAAQQAKRYDELAARGIATREQVDTSRTAVAALNATVEADKAAVENAKV